MKNLLIYVIALLCLVASCENDQKSDESNQQELVTDSTAAVVYEDTITKMPPEAHLYDANEHWSLLNVYLGMNSGTYFHYSEHDYFAETYCSNRKGKDVFSYTYDGLFCADWVEKHWREYTTVKVLDVKYDKQQSTDSTDVYHVEFLYVFSEDKKGNKFDDIQFTTTLTECADGKFDYGCPYSTDY